MVSSGSLPHTVRSGSLLPLLVALCLLSILTQPLRRDSSFALACYLLVATHTQHTALASSTPNHPPAASSLLRFGLLLLVVSIAADLIWLLLFGPVGMTHAWPPYLTLSAVGHGVGTATANVPDEQRLSTGAAAAETPGSISADSAAGASISASLGQLFVLLPLLTVKLSLVLLLRGFEGAAAPQDGHHTELQQRSLAGSGTSAGGKQLPQGAGVGPTTGGVGGASQAPPGATEPPRAVASRGGPGVRAGGLSTSSRRDGLDASAGMTLHGSAPSGGTSSAVETSPFTDPTAGSDSPGPVGLEFLGRALLLLGMLASLFRADGSCALGLLVLLAMRESPVYFSRVLLGATLVAIALDLAWLHAADHAAAASTLLTTEDAFKYLSTIPPAEAGALVGTLATAPLKLLLAFAAVALNLRQHAAAPQAFRFDEAMVARAAADDGSQHDTAPQARGAANGYGPVACSGGGYMLLLDHTSSSALTADAEPSGAISRAVARHRREAERRQLALSKSLFTLAFLSVVVGAATLLLGDALEVRQTDAQPQAGSSSPVAAKGPRGASLVQSSGLLELPMLSLLSAFACLRHTQLCGSSLARCSRLLRQTAAMHATLLLMLGSLLASQASLLVSTPLSPGFSSLSLLHKAALACQLTLVATHGLALAAIARLDASLTAPLLARPLQVLGRTSRSGRAAALTVLLAAGVLCTTRLDADIFLALLALLALVEVQQVRRPSARAWLHSTAVASGSERGCTTLLRRLRGHLRCE